MKPRFSNQTNHALTLFEVLVVIAVLAVLVAVVLPDHSRANRRSGKINCINNLKEMGVAYRIWEGDNGDKYPMEVSVTNGGAMELVVTGNVLVNFLVMSNELSTPKILHCPEDKDHIQIDSFAFLGSSNISYFVGVDAKELRPQMFLSGDDNILVDGVQIKSGSRKLSTNSTIAWTTARHNRIGNIGLAEGSVWQGTSPGLQMLLQNTGIAINRLAIP
jgi:prepilin-type N-terminal cleavage/methylation domain-containing protein